MYKKALIFGMALGMMTACQDDAEEVLVLEANVQAISASDLPAGSLSFVESNFQGEVITDAYKVTSTKNEVSYEAFLSNDANLVFDNGNQLSGFGDIGSMVDLDTDAMRTSFEGAMDGSGYGDMGGQGGGSGMGGSGMGAGGQGDMNGRGEGFRGNPDVIPVEVAIADLPATITDYITATYPDNEILKAFSVTFEDITEYHVLVQEVGALLFDADGNFLDVLRRGGRMGFMDGEQVDIADLPIAITDYITANYPEGEIVRAQKVTNEDGTINFRVGVMEVGLLVFDEAGEFIEIHTRDGERGRGHGRGSRG